MEKGPLEKGQVGEKEGGREATHWGGRGESRDWRVLLHMKGKCHGHRRAACKGDGSGAAFSPAHHSSMLQGEHLLVQDPPQQRDRESSNWEVP